MEFLITGPIAFEVKWEIEETNEMNETELDEGGQGGWN